MSRRYLLLNVDNTDEAASRRACGFAAPAVNNDSAQFIDIQLSARCRHVWPAVCLHRGILLRTQDDVTFSCLMDATHAQTACS